MNYIGSKLSLVEEILACLDRQGVPAEGVAVDLFAGTGTVGQVLKRRGHTVLSNDWQFYSYVTNVALVELDAVPSFDALWADARWATVLREVPAVAIPDFPPHREVTDRGQAEAALAVLRYLEALPGQEGPFFQAYCEGGSAGRKYFEAGNGRRIQAMRDCIRDWRLAELLTRQEECWLVASLVEASDRVANTASVYGAYLKQVKRSAARPLRPVCMWPVPSPREEHRAYCGDSLAFVKGLEVRPTLVYIDPPYNARQYSANYHILETIARWDLEQWAPRGVTGLRGREEQRSRYCSGREAYAAFDELLGSTDAEHVLFSYNNEGLLSREELERLFGEHFRRVSFNEVAFKRFRADRDHANRVYKTDETTEFLVLGSRG